MHSWRARRKEILTVLPRVGIALAQLIKPITSSIQATAQSKLFRRERPSAENSSENPKKKESPPPSAQIIPFPTPPKPEASAPPSTTPLSAAHSFLQLLSQLQQQRPQLMLLFGAHAYLKAQNLRKKGGGFRKGAMLDKKAD